MTPSTKTLAKLKSEIYINAVRLFSDACILYQNKSYSSAYAFAILSLEELGKLEMVDHICGDISINPDSNHQEFLDSLFSRFMFFSHKNKQMWASDPMGNSNKKRLKEIHCGAIDRAKQNSLYVGYSRRRILSPKKLTSVKAYAELVLVYNKIVDIQDIGFNGFDCFSDSISRAKSKRYIAKIERAFDGLRQPR